MAKGSLVDTNNVADKIIGLDAECTVQLWWNNLNIPA